MTAVRGERPARRLTVLVMAGGTGGHVYPALAVAERLRADGRQVFWLGTRRGLEAHLVPRTEIEIRYIRISGLRGKGLLHWIQAPGRLALAWVQSLVVIFRVWPQLVLGMGGFVAGPGGIAAWLLRRPLLIHEQNAIPGFTNRALARIANGVMEAFPGSFPAYYGAQHTGNPVRAQIAALPVPAKRLAGRNGSLRLLVLGGSQGARALNEVVPLAVGALEDRGTVEVRHQVGVQDLEVTRASYDAVGIKARLDAFIDDMAEAYGWADLVVCRAGAMTVSELAAAGVASILVPYPFAVDDHQTCNARYLSDAGAAVLVQQSELKVPYLSRLLTEFHMAPGRLLAMAMAARNLAIPDATERVVKACMEVACA